MTIARVAFAAAALLFAISCVSDRAVILERADVQSFEVRQTPESGRPVSLRISGLVSHSALAYSRHRDLRHGVDTLDVLVELQPAAEGKSGNFDFVVFLPDDVTHVVFGEKRELIWRRP